MGNHMFRCVGLTFWEDPSVGKKTHVLSVGQCTQEVSLNSYLFAVWDPN